MNACLMGRFDSGTIFVIVRTLNAFAGLSNERLPLSYTASVIPSLGGFKSL
jgi:hypothetical protein